MSIISWNCRGMAAPATIRELHELCKAHQPAMMFLMETRAQIGRVETVKRRLKFNNVFVVNPRGLSGGLCLFWNDKVQVQVLSSSPNFIHTAVEFTDTKDGFDCSFIYGNPVFQQRRGLWSNLLRFQTDKDRQWLCMGDFNEILAQHEKNGICPYHPQRAELFRDFMNISGLMEMELQGCSFTWMSNPRNGVIVKEKLDRVLANWPWRSDHPNAIATALPIVSSDHSPIVFQPFPKEKSGVSFHFEAFWAEHVDCCGVVEEGWLENVNEEEPWGVVKEKLKNSKRVLQKWHHQTFRKANQEIHKRKQELQYLLDHGGQHNNFDRIRQIQEDIDALWSQEEMYWGQRARVKWLNEGDRNTKFFHATTIQRRGRNRIQKIQNSAGQWVEGKEAIFATILDHFEEVYKSDDPTGIDACLTNIPNLVTSSMNEKLLAPVSEEEIRLAAFSLGALKAPGPDGFNGLFFQKNWDCVKYDVCRAVMNFFNGGEIPMELNETMVTLIPKIPLPESINHLRPISCCNFTYKIISKLFVMRLKGVMGALITSNQSAFVGGRQIQDNLIIAHEVFHSLKRRDTRGRKNVAIKLDMSKAYDRLEWGFVKKCLLAYGFHPTWVEMVMKLISSVSYMYKVNGFTSAKLLHHRGLRQGDPLSPYIFILAVDTLSHMLNNALQQD